MIDRWATEGEETGWRLNGDLYLKIQWEGNGTKGDNKQMRRQSEYVGSVESASSSSTEAIADSQQCNQLFFRLSV